MKRPASGPPYLVRCLVWSLVACFSPFAIADDSRLTIATEKRELTVEKVVSGLNHPWSIAFISETDWLVTEREGRLRRIVNEQLLPDAIDGLPSISANGQGGLLDVVLHPDFANNQTIYLTHTPGRMFNTGTEVLRATLKSNALENVTTIFNAVPKSRGGRHYGSRLAFDNDGLLYISLGDRGVRMSSQQLFKHTGSIIRLNDDGSVPESNPFANNADVRSEIYSYGHRNVQGMAYDSLTGTLWAHEHGPQGGDELNLIHAGQNYGWPIITYGKNYGTGTKIGEGTEKAGMLQPVTYWDPSIAPSGLAIVNSPHFPEWQGNLLVGALKFQLVARLEIKDGKVIHEERILRGLGRIRDVRQGPDGWIYVLTDEADGALYRIK